MNLRPFHSGYCLLAVGAALCLAPGAPLLAQDLEHDVSHRLVEIRPNFKGTELLFFGSISAEADSESIDPNKPLDVVVVMRGPSRTFSVRHKERVFGIWLNRQGKKLSDVPSFYFLASTRPLKDIASPELLARYSIGSASWDVLDLSVATAAEESPHPDIIGEVSGSAPSKPPENLLPPEQLAQHAAEESFAPLADEVGVDVPVIEADPYREALRRALSKNATLVEHEGGVEFIGRHLFRTEINMPAIVPQGHYGAEVYLLQDGQVVDAQYSVVTVDKKGIERTISELAEEHALSYGLIGVLLAVAAGWLSSVIFRRL